MDDESIEVKVARTETRIGALEDSVKKLFEKDVEQGKRIDGIKTLAITILVAVVVGSISTITTIISTRPVP